jgi:hypothetical protein
MSLEDPKKTEPTVSDNAKIRRKFLKRASAGTLIAAIPGRTAWAGLLNSIVASGHGSDFSDGVCLQLYSPGYWKHPFAPQNHYWGPVSTNITFNAAFGGLPIGTGLAVDSNTTLLEVLNNPGGSKLGGPSNVNFFLACFYLNAANHGDARGIQFPVIGAGQPFSTLQLYADYLYLEAVNDSSGVGMLLSDMIDVYHIDSNYNPDDATGNGSSNLPICD